MEKKFICKKNDAIVTFELFAGKNKDYYLEIEMEFLRQRFNLYNRVLIGDIFEEKARSQLRSQRINNPTKSRVCS
jgi:hypothetical protein